MSNPEVSAKSIDDMARIVGLPAQHHNSLGAAWLATLGTAIVESINAGDDLNATCHDSHATVPVGPCGAWMIVADLGAWEFTYDNDLDVTEGDLAGQATRMLDQIAAYAARTIRNSIDNQQEQ